MDLDILLYGATVCDTPELKLPRPDLLRRPYMLGPAAEIAPGFVHPTVHRTLAELWQELRLREPHELRPVALGWTSSHPMRGT
jgi:2-amino-4-hydroxy-6-hydroxymethyldihydropteridine diphosphokinase